MFGLVPLTGFLALILVMLAAVFGLLGLGRVRKGYATNKTMSTVSTLLGVGVATLGIWGIVIMFQATNQFVSDMDQVGRDLEQSSQNLEQSSQELDSQLDESSRQLQKYQNCLETSDAEDMGKCSKLLD